MACADDSPTEPTSRRLRSNAAGPSQLEECGPSSIPAAPPARSGQPRKRELPGSMQHGNPQPPKPARPQPGVFWPWQATAHHGLPQ